jgi:hypothetical protein
MDGSAFDTLARLTATGTGRRRLLQSGIAALLGSLGLTAWLDVQDAVAASCRKRCKKKAKKKDWSRKKKRACLDRCERGLAEGSRCSSDNQCSQSDNLVCDVPPDASNSDRKCCRGEGASCTPPGQSGAKCCTGEAGEREFKCVSFVCRQTV